MKWPHTTALCLLVFALGVAVGVFATRSTPPAPASAPTTKPAAPIAAATSKPTAISVPASRLERTTITPKPPPSTVGGGARYITTRPALPPVLEPIARGAVAWRTDSHEWNNVGRRTVGAAIQSQYWAISRGEMEYLASSVLMDDDTRANLQRLRDSASPKLREQFPTPESFAAFFIASQPAALGMMIGSVLPNSVSETDVTIGVSLIEPGADRASGGGAQRFRRTASGEWLRVLGPGELSQWHQMLKWDRELSKSRTWVLNQRR